MSKILSLRVPSVLALALGSLLVAPGLRAEEESAPPRSSLEVFEALYAQVEAAAEDGRLPASTATAAGELAFDLERELIRRDAEIRILRLEVARFDGEAQQRALDRLIGAAVARELVVIDRLRRLEELSGMRAVPSAVGDEGEQGKKGGYELVFEPKDLIDDPDS